MLGLPVDFAKILDAIKQLPLKWWNVVAIFSGFLLFCPDKYLELFSLKNIAEEYKPCIGFVFLFAIILLVINLLSSIGKLASDFRKKKKDKRISEERINKSIKELESLSVPEASILIYCYTRNQKTVHLSIYDGYVNTLFNKHHLNRVLVGPGHPYEWPHTVQNHIWNHIPKLIEKFDYKEIEQSFRSIQNSHKLFA
ncbi:MAG: super-infection exclusion protein B [Alphaproteobacteria bacterium]|jgi:hypothetical protein